MTSLLSDIIVVMMIILFFTLSTAFSAPPDHQVPKQDLRNKITGKSATAPQLEHAALFASSDVLFKTATGKTKQQVEGSDYKIVSNQLDKDIPKSPVMTSQSTLLSSPRPPELHL